MRLGGLMFRGALEVTNGWRMGGVTCWCGWRKLAHAISLRLGFLNPLFQSAPYSTLVLHTLLSPSCRS